MLRVLMPFRIVIVNSMSDVFVCPIEWCEIEWTPPNWVKNNTDQIIRFNLLKLNKTIANESLVIGEQLVQSEKLIWFTFPFWFRLDAGRSPLGNWYKRSKPKKKKNLKKRNCIRCVRVEYNIIYLFKRHIDLEKCFVFQLIRTVLLAFHV